MPLLGHFKSRPKSQYLHLTKRDKPYLNSYLILMRFIVFAWLLILCTATALGTDGNLSASVGAEGEILNASALQSMVANSSANLQTYRFLLEMDQRMEIFNLSGLNNSSQVIQTNGLGQGSLNATSKSMKLILASLIVPIGDVDNSSAVAIEEYMLNDTIYMKTDGNWTQMKLSMADLWTTQDKAGQQLKLLNQSNIAFLGMETVGGQKCYKVNLRPDMTAFSKIISEEVSGFPGTINLSQIYRNSTMQITYWINKENYLLKKTKVNLAMKMTPPGLGVTPKGPENQEIRQLTNTTLTFIEYNGPVSIKLPAQAKTAAMLPLEMNSSGTSASTSSR